jgi:hypothetical protein
MIRTAATRCLLLAAGLTLAACGPETLTVTMAALNNSGENGTAVLTDDGKTLKVVISLSKGSDTGQQPVHIHDGDCPGLGAIYKPLSVLVGGASTTELTDLRLSALKAGSYAINAHNSVTTTTYVSCGVIK